MSGNENESDEALIWAGGRDPSHYETPEPKAPKPSKKVAALHAAADDEELSPPMSAVVLVSLGLLGGIYLLYTIGWFSSWQRFIYGSADDLGLVVFQAQQVLAILAAPLWFVLTMVFTRERKPAVRLVWLLIGALLLVPWSFTFGR